MAVELEKLGELPAEEEAEEAGRSQSPSLPARKLDFRLEELGKLGELPAAEAGLSFPTGLGVLFPKTALFSATSASDYF